MFKSKLFFYLEIPIEEGFHTYVLPLEKKLITYNVLLYRSLEYRLNCAKENLILTPYEKVTYEFREYLAHQDLLKSIYGNDLELNELYIEYFFKKRNIIFEMFHSVFVDHIKFFLHKDWYYFNGYGVIWIDFHPSLLLVV